MPKPVVPTLSPYTEQLPDVNNPATWADRTPLFWNWVTGDGYANMANALAYSDAVADYMDTALAGSETLIDSVAENAAQLATFSHSNLIINGNFGVNQGAVSGTVVLAANEYGHDQWKAGLGGCTYTFATVENVTTITITSGTLIQPIPGDNLQSGTHILSWEGTATGKIGGGAFSASGVTGAVTGGTDIEIEFSTGTLSKVQFETGSGVTAFEFKGFDEELRRCQFYFRRLPFFADGQITVLATRAGGALYNGGLTTNEMHQDPITTVSGSVVLSSPSDAAVTGTLTVTGHAGGLHELVFERSGGGTVSAGSAVILLGSVSGYIELDARIY